MLLCLSFQVGLDSSRPMSKRKHWVVAEILNDQQNNFQFIIAYGLTSFKFENDSD